MTYHQYGTLKYLIKVGGVDLEKAGELSMVTFSSLIKRGWVQRHGQQVVISQEGIEAYEGYSQATANFRHFNTGLTDHVRDLLHLNKLHLAHTKLQQKKAS